MHNPGPDYESVEFRRSPAYRDMQDALRFVGVETYAQMLALPRLQRDRFHDAWTERMRQRVEQGEAAPKGNPVNLTLREQVRTLHAEGMGDADMARTIGVTATRVWQVRQALGLPRHDTTQLKVLAVIPSRPEEAVTVANLREATGLGLSSVHAALGRLTARGAVKVLMTRREGRGPGQRAKAAYWRAAA